MLLRCGLGNNPLIPAEAVTDGIVLSNSDGVAVTRNWFFSVLGVGIRLDANSDDDRIIGNYLDPTGGPNAIDDGTSNCWKRNICPEATCPGPSGCP